jgi:hypothetical protein
LCSESSNSQGADDHILRSDRDVLGSDGIA